MDARILEDFVGWMRVKAQAKGTVGPNSFRFDFLSRDLPIRGTAGAPPSRGARCLLTDALGRTVVQDPCALTDGALNVAHRYPPELICPAPHTVGGTKHPGCFQNNKQPDSVVVDLGQVQDLDLVVIRGCFITCKLSTSLDGVSWTPEIQLGFPNEDESIAIRADGPTRSPENSGPLPRRARYVRFGERIDYLREVSIW